MSKMSVFIMLNVVLESSTLRQHSELTNDLKILNLLQMVTW